MDTLKTTPLTNWHKENGAKMAPFAGFDMPVQYAGIIAEHKHTRTQASIFDICHMGEFKLTGTKAREDLNRTVTQDLNTLAPGKCRYGFLLNEKSGIMDDLIIYCLGENEYMLVVNGACEEKDFNHIADQLGDDSQLVNISGDTAKIDLQGPLSLEVLEDTLGGTWSGLKYFNFQQAEFNGAPIIVSRTGYTGELGYEFYLPTEKALILWEKLAADQRVAPVGLGARDTLRLELGYPLYGQDLDEEHNPNEAGYSFLLTKTDDYTGRSGLDTVRENLIPLTIQGRRTPRHDDEVMVDGKKIGRITSGSFSPSLGHCIALAYVQADFAEHNDFIVKTARSELEATKSTLPFYTKGTARKKLD